MVQVARSTRIQKTLKQSDGFVANAEMICKVLTDISSDSIITTYLNDKGVEPIGSAPFPIFRPHLRSREREIEVLSGESLKSRKENEL